MELEHTITVNSSSVCSFTGRNLCCRMTRLPSLRIHFSSSILMDLFIRDSLPCKSFPSLFNSSLPNSSTTTVARTNVNIHVVDSFVNSLPRGVGYPARANNLLGLCDRFWSEYQCEYPTSAARQFFEKSASLAFELRMRSSCCFLGSIILHLYPTRLFSF